MAGSSRPAFLLAASLAPLLACGGQSLRHAGDDEGGGGGSGGSAGSASPSGGCAGVACPSGCTADGRTYEHGASFTFGEPGACGTCTCNDGKVACATMPCPGGRCPVIESVYATYAPYIGRHCNRFADVPQCDVLVPSRLPCGCPTFVSRESALLPWLAEWQELACDNDISCEPCPAPVGGACTEDAFCIDQY